MRGGRDFPDEYTRGGLLMNRLGAMMRRLSAAPWAPEFLGLHAASCWYGVCVGLLLRITSPDRFPAAPQTCAMLGLEDEPPSPTIGSGDETPLL